MTNTTELVNYRVFFRSHYIPFFLFPQTEDEGLRKLGERLNAASLERKVTNQLGNLNAAALYFLDNQYITFLPLFLYFIP